MYSRLKRLEDLRQSAVETEHHLHNYERWFEEAGTPSGETHIAVGIGDSDGDGAFRISGGDSSATPTWGSWVQVLGSSDTPVQAGKTFFDLHRIQIMATADVAVVHYIQFAFGASGAAALAAGDYTEMVFFPPSILGSQGVTAGPMDMICERQAAGTKVWARLLAVGEATSWLDFFVGIHEYDE